MHFDRRDFLKTGAAFTFAAGLPQFASSQGAFAPQPGCVYRKPKPGRSGDEARQGPRVN
jgi:hypothetical protein